MNRAQHLAGTGEDHLALVMAIGKVGIWELDLETGTAWRNPHHDAIFGYPELLDEWTYEQFVKHVVPEDREAVEATFGTALREGQDWAFECRINRADGEERWITAHGKPLRRDDGSIYALIGHVIDITDNKRDEEHLRLLTNELNHRVRNMLAMTKAMLNLSALNAQDVPSFSRAVEDRVAALARAHDLLSQQGLAPIAIGSVIDIELRAFAGLESRITVEGATDAVLASVHAERFALILHELITNAFKHGALSNDTGKLTITVERDGGDVRIDWVESGGPRVEEPTRRGYGSTLLRKVAGRDGTVDVTFPHEGARCTIRLPAKGQSRSLKSRQSPEDARPEPVRKSSEGIAGLNVLLLEDEPLIALNLEDILIEAGARMFGSYASCATALEAIDKAEAMPDVAVLDINLSGETSAQVADRLEREGVPFVFTTGYGQGHELLERFPERLALRKPTQTSDLIAALSAYG